MVSWENQQSIHFFDGKENLRFRKATERDFIYASNEPKSVLARDLGDCRDNLRNSRSMFFIVLGERTDMRRIRLRVAYDGTAYCGWQVQPEVPTIEGELNQAISRLTKEEIIVIGASRTDAGVHAKVKRC